jgi:hypothetical protein
VVVAVVVAQHAVFAVETKAKRKRRPAAAGQETHKVIFNGRELIYPLGTDRDALDQLRRNAQALAERLGRLTAGPVVVRPVLVLPGWWVERTGKSEVTVVNDKASQGSNPTTRRLTTTTATATGVAVAVARSGSVSFSTCRLKRRIDSLSACKSRQVKIRCKSSYMANKLDFKQQVAILGES